MSDGPNVLQGTSRPVITAITPGIAYAGLVGGFLLAGFGMALGFAPVSNLLIGSVAEGDIGKASGANNTVREVGGALAQVPWLERWPVTVRATPAPGDGQWVLTDHTGSLPLLPGPDANLRLVALSGGRPVDITCEWTPSGLSALAVHLGDGAAARSVDVGPSEVYGQREGSALSGAGAR